MPRLFLLALSLLLALVATATAEDEISVHSGKRAFFGDYYYWNSSTCAYGSKPTTRIVQQPKHGTLSFAWEFTKSTNGLPKHCYGKIKGLKIFYTSNRGYRGPDSFKVSLTRPRFENDQAGTSYTVREQFTVK